MKLVILHSADVFVHDFVAVIATHDLYVAVILLRLNYFQFYVKSCLCLRYLAPSSVLHSALVANCSVETSNLGTESPRRQSHSIFGTRAG